MRSTLLFAIACLASSALSPGAAEDDPKTSTHASSATDSDAAYSQALEKRAAGVLDALKLEDAAKASRIREAVIAQYRNLRRLHDTRDANLRSLRDRPDSDQAERDRRIRDERDRTEAAAAALHEQFLVRLSADLSPEQIDQVKDVMTYNKLRVTYNAYCEMLPELTPEQKRTIFDLLKEAREKAAYAGSAEEKSGVFDRAKGRINNDLAVQGFDLKQASKRWAERRARAK
jgi:hypothetical protein